MPLILSDLMLFIYFLNILLGGFGFCLFAWWAGKKGSASAWYIYVMLVLMGIVISTVPEFMSRVERLQGNYDEMLLMHQTWWWASRKIPLTIALFLITGHATWKLVVKR